MDDDDVNDAGARDRPDAVRIFRVHLAIYAGVNGLLFLINLLTDGPWWIFWPLFGWGAVVAAHWLYAKSANVDEHWVDERTMAVRLGASDLSHMEDIKKRRGKAFSQTPPAATKPRD